MKIGIVTFWQTRDNYGQMLQCWALQHYLRSCGHEPYLIRYRHTEAFAIDFKITVKGFIKNLLRLRLKSLLPKKTILPPLSNNDKQRDFETFKKEKLQVSERTYLSLQELQKEPPEADCYIVGSDQVWSKLLYFKENRVFFLDFGSESPKRIAYAASFSYEKYPKDIQVKLRNALSRFNAISVREKTGVKICEGIGIHAQLVVDPTLLLHDNDYYKNFHIEKKKRSGIFLYVLNIRDPKEVGWEELKTFAEENKTEITVTTASGYVDSKELFSNANYKYPTVDGWIKNIASAELVVTTSFHGIVFCLLMHTPFIFIPLGGEYAKGNNRVLDLFSYLGIDSGVYDKRKNYSEIVTSKYDWDEIDKRIQKLRTESISFLIDNL